MDDYLYHFGVKGMKWGVRKDRKKTSSRRKAAKVNSEDTGSNKKKLKLTDKQKKAIAIGAAVAATALIAYGGYKLGRSGKLDGLIDVGKKKANSFLSGDVDVPDTKVIKKKLKNESLSDTLKLANPLKGTVEGKNNCVPSAMVGFLRQSGYDAVALGINGNRLNTAGVVQECFKGAKVVEGSAVKFGRSKKDAAEMLVKRFGDNAEGVCSVQWKGKDSGHCFSWKIRDGIASFFDSNMGYDDSMVSKYFSNIDQNGRLTLARLDNAEIDFDALKKYVKFR